MTLHSAAHETNLAATLRGAAAAHRAPPVPAVPLVSDTAHVYATNIAKVWHRSVATTSEGARDQGVLCGQRMPTCGGRWFHAGLIYDSELAEGIFRICKKCAAVSR